MSMYIVTSNLSVIELIKFSQLLINEYVKKCICLSYSLCISLFQTSVEKRDDTYQRDIKIKLIDRKLY